MAASPRLAPCTSTDSRLGRTLALLTLLLMVSAAGAAAQAPPPNDPLELQKRAVARIDSVVDRFRRTGDTRLQISELVQAGTELPASNRALAARQNWSALAFGLIKQGHVYRLQGQWAEAIAFYQSAQEAATRGRDVVRQSDALAWRALAESSRRNLGPAVSIATQAVQLAETTSDKDILAQALDVLGSAQIAQLNLVGRRRDDEPRGCGRRTGDRSDRRLLCVSESFRRLSQARRPMRLQPVVRRVQPGARSRQGRSRAGASSIVRQAWLHAAWFSKPTQFMRDVADRRALVQSQQSSTPRFTSTGVFQPKKAGDVLVTDKFAAGAQPKSRRRSCAGAIAKADGRAAWRLADVNEARTASRTARWRKCRGTMTPRWAST